MPFRAVCLLLLHLMHIACDGVVGSPRVRDACGVCGGNNSTCQIISGIFTKPYLEEGYRLVAQIPAGACSIHIEELVPTSNYLALRDIRRHFILNGDWNIDNSGAYPGAGASFVYRRQSDSTGETIAAIGPISEPIDLFILYRQANRGIKYEYAIKRNDSLTSVLPRLPAGSGLPQVPGLPRLPTGSGRRQRPTLQGNTLLPPAGRQRPQNAAPPLPSDGPGGAGFVSSLYQQRRLPPHAGGHRQRPNTGRRLPKPGRRVVPKTGPRGNGRRIDPKTGRARPAGGRSSARRRRRRRRSRFQWVVPGYSECSRTCGGGTKTPEVVCMRRKRKQLVRDGKCDPRRRPRPHPLTCNTSPCPASSGWEANPWSPCTTTCGAGHQTRTFLCVRAGQPVEVTECVGRPSEPETQPCNMGPCSTTARWQIGTWSPCSVSCGWGSRTRQVTCTDRRSVAGCPEADRPRDSAPCRRIDCPAEPAQNDRQPAGWMFTDWTEQCSVECGQGVQSRGVTCGGGSDRCDASRRPLDTRPCKTDRGCGGIWFTGPWSQCSQECGAGQATRSVLCVRQAAGQYAVTAERSCAGSARPSQRQPCGADRRDCRPRWFATEWAACSASCGPSWQRRVVACVDFDGRRTAGCDPAGEPAVRRPCLLADCPKTEASADSPGTAPVADEPGDEPGDEPAEDESSWDGLLRAQTAEEPLTALISDGARAGDPTTGDSTAGDPTAGDPTAGVSSLDESTEDASSADESSPVASTVDGWSAETAARLAEEAGTTPVPVSDRPVGQTGSSTSAAPTVPPPVPEPTLDRTETTAAPDRPSAGAAEPEPLLTTERPATAATPVEERPAAAATPIEERPATAALPADGDNSIIPASQHQAGGGPAESRKGGSGNRAGGNNSDSCTDKFSYCSLVQQARLCQYNFYASSCCAACKGAQ